MDKETMEACEQQVGYEFRNDFWLWKALTHSSNKGNSRLSNERLEFLGDAVLGMVVSEHLFTRLKERAEGELTKIKSRVVSRAMLAQRSKILGLGTCISVGKGMLEGDELPVSVLANVFEAIIGAIYLDGGIEPAQKFILEKLSEELDEAIANQDHGNYKSLLQQYAQREFSSTPAYRVVSDCGPDHDKAFLVVTMIAGQRYESAWGRSKKEAEQRAAELTYLALLANGGHAANATNLTVHSTAEQAAH